MAWGNVVDSYVMSVALWDFGLKMMHVFVY